MAITFIIAKLFLDGSGLFLIIEHKLILYTHAKKPPKPKQTTQKTTKPNKTKTNYESNKGRSYFSGTMTLCIFNQKAIKVSLWIVDTVNMSRTTDF